MVLAITLGKMENNILGIGKTMKCMIQVFIDIKMVIFMKECMKKTKNNGMEYISGQMDVFIKDILVKEDNMAQVNYQILIKID